MEMLRSGFQAVGLGSGDNDRKTGMPTSAETIERLVDRLNCLSKLPYDTSYVLCMSYLCPAFVFTSSKIIMNT